MLNLKIDKPITEAGVRGNINVCIQYIYYWITGTGAVGLHNLMEDAATAEIARSQLWQWVRYKSRTENGIVISPAYYKAIRDEELAKVESNLKNKAALMRAVELTDKLVLSDHFEEFLTLPGYALLNNFQAPKL